jgi:hypothetical protein
MYVTRRRPVVGLTLVGLAAALALAGCSAGDSSTNSTGAAGAAQGGKVPADTQQDRADAAAPAQGNPAQANEAQGNPAQGNAEQDKGAAPAGFLPDDRAIIFTGAVTIRVADVDDATAKVTAIATAAGGFIGADKRSSDDKRSEATMQLRVPSGRFGTAVDEVAKLGKQVSRTVDTDDVTEEVVDLGAKIASQQASVARTRALFAQAKTIADITSVESELAKRESELATLQARKRKLDDLTTLSTITATLLGPEAPAPQAAPKEKDKAGFIAGLKTGWHGFVGVVSVVLVVLGFLLPFALVVGVPGVVAWWLLRARRRREASVTPAPAPAVAAPATAPQPPSLS